MQVLDPNNIKIYNLSAGKSLPEWLSDRKRRALVKKNVDIRRRIELIQDFEMPGVSNCIKVSTDGHYIMATGTYKPRVRCYEVDNLAMKFERCFDSEVVAFEMLSDDYTKVVFLQCDRFVELHSAEGRYHRLRIPKFGHDLKYHYETCDLYFVGASSDIYRLNLESGQFVSPFVSSSSELNKIAINSMHGLVVVGGKEGKIEAWDPRARSSVGTLDCALSCIADRSTSNLHDVPEICALQFDGSLTLGVGVSTGQILLYDIRSSKPFVVKDHMYGLPIKDVAFQNENVLSMDSSVVKIWNKNTGSMLTSIESGRDTEFNNLCLVPNSGMMFIANESTKIRTYYIPSLGPAPRWCGFLDALTEELEENTKEIIYDDYKFITKKELDELGLDHLIGTNLLRAYMHGYFIDVRLYRKAKSAAEPFEFGEYRKKLIRETIESDRTNRVQIKEKLPSVNTELAVKLMEEENAAKVHKKKSKGRADLLHDDRFKALFENTDFEIDTNAEEYKLLNPVIKKMDKGKEERKQLMSKYFERIEDEEKEVKSSSEDDSDYSSDDDKQWVKELKNEYRTAKKTRISRQKEERRNEINKRNDDNIDDGNEHERDRNQFNNNQPRMFGIKTGHEFPGLNHNQINNASLSEMNLGERLERESKNVIEMLPYGNRAMTFVSSKNGFDKKRQTDMKKHHNERKSLMRRPPSHLKKPKFR